MPEQILPAAIVDEMRTSYLDYAMSVIVGRALPDVRDGLKPVQRRILFAMRELGLTPDKPFRKSATVVGEVIGKYHPHGDQAIYDTLVRLAQDFSLRYMLVGGQGNFGSIDGDPPAAYRYTEARLSRVAMAMLSDIEEGTVDFVPNFDGRLEEPTVLPSGFPNLLANGSSGIAVGMATNIPPHNIGELIDGFVALIENPELSDQELFKHIKGPDFPTGGIIVGTKGIQEAYATGRGRILVRARYTIEDKKKSVFLVFTEIPYMVTKSLVIEQIATLAREKKIEGIADLRDESDREGMRIVVEIKKGFEPEVLVRQLFKHTALQTTFGAILIALEGLQPKLMTLRQMMARFIDHRRDVVTRRTRFRLEKAEARAHILEGFRKALGIIDEIVAVIKKSQDANAAREGLMSKFGFSEAQAKAILDLKLAHLTRLEGDKIKSEYEALLRDIEYFKSILASETLLMSVIRDELCEIKKGFGDKRRTDIAPEENGEFDMEELIQEEDMVVLVTREGYIKRIPLRQYRTMRRRVQGRNTLSTYEDDYPIATKIASTHSYTMFVMNNGAVYWLKTYRIPQAGFGAKGKPLPLFFKTREEEQVVDALVFDPEEDASKFLVVGTEKGLIKKIKFENVLGGRKGTPVIVLREGDRVADAILVETEDVVMAKDDGKAVRLRLDSIPLRSRRSGAVKGTRVAREGRVVSLIAVKEGATLFTITERGYGKHFDPDLREGDRLQLHPLGRGSQGVTVQRVTPKTGALVRLLASSSSNEQMVILTQNGVSARIDLSGVPEYHRDSQGVRIMNIGEGDRVADASIVPEPEEEGSGERPDSEIFNGNEEKK